MAYIPRQKRKSYQPKREPRFGKDPFYNLKAWRDKSHAVRAHYDGECAVCEFRLSEMTDHIVSRKQGGADFDWDNLLPMCHTCHNKKRGMEKTAKGPLIPTRESDTEPKLVPVDKQDIIDLLKVKKIEF